MRSSFNTLASLALAATLSATSPLKFNETQFNETHKAVERRFTTTSNDFVNLASPADCKPFLFLFARGTTEVGNMGETVGPALQDNLQKLMPGKFMYQGVTYSADVAGDIELGAPGGKVATGVINDCFAKCPKTQMFVSGYSEGAMVAHDGVGGASAAAKANVAGVLVYGDPFNGRAIAGYPESKVKTFCATGDQVCDLLFIISAAHLSYVGTDTTEGAAWIQSIAQGLGTSNSTSNSTSN